MDLGLKNKIVLVSGGASGIGEGIVKALLKESAMPVIADRNRESGNRLIRELKKEGKEAFFICSDLQVVGNCKKVVAKTLQKYGRLDSLINNAGGNDNVGLEHGTPDAFIKSIKQNLLHYYSLTHFALNSLKKAQGSIVNISSKVAVTGQGGTSGYAAAKGAQLALTREWAVELLPYGIRVNTILPAEVMTPSYSKWLEKFPEPQLKLQQIISTIPLGKRLTTIDEIASMAVFLLSAKASHITGQFLFVDGGYVHLDRSQI